VLLSAIALLVGCLDIASVLYFHLSLVERARAGARWAAVNDFDLPRIQNVVVYGTPSSGAARAPLLYRLASGQVAAQLRNPGTRQVRVEVSISNYPIQFYSPWIAGSRSAMTVTASMTHEPSLP
jgi:hypothetical protein